MSLLEHLNVSIIHRDHATFTRLLGLFTGEQLNEAFFVDGNMNGYRPLHFACHVNNYEAVNQLIKINNIDANIVDDKGDTPFMVAIWKSSVECVELMANNKNVNIFTWVGDWTFERRRTEKDKEKISDYVRKKRAERIQLGTVSLLHQLIEYIECKDDLNFTRILKKMTGKQVNKGDHLENRPIHVACVSNNHKALEKLLKVDNIEPNAEDTSGFTAFTKAFILSRAECMELLLKDMRVNIFQPILPAVVEGSKADRVKVGKILNEETNRRIGLGKATLVQQFNDAIERHDSSDVPKILKKMNIDEINEAEPGLLYTPLHLACRVDNSKAVAELLKIDGIDLNARTRYGRTAFMLAIRCCSLEALEVLMEDSRFHIDSLGSVDKLIGTVNNRYGTPCKDHEVKKTRELIRNFIDKRKNMKKLESQQKETKKSDEQETKTHDNAAKNKDNNDVSKLENKHKETKKSDKQETKTKEIHDNAEKNKDNSDVSKLENNYRETKKSDEQETKTKEINNDVEKKKDNIDVSKLENKHKDTKKSDKQEIKTKDIHDNAEKNRDNSDVSKLENNYRETKKSEEQATKTKEIHNNVEKKNDNIDVVKLENKCKETKKSDEQETQTKEIHYNAEKEKENIDVFTLENKDEQETKSKEIHDNAKHSKDNSDASIVHKTKPEMDFDTLCWRCSTTQVKLYKCGGCLKARYCNKQCITNDWEEHMNYCLKVQEKRNKKQIVPKKSEITTLL